MAHPERFELPTNRFEAGYSIQLSYGCVRTEISDGWGASKQEKRSRPATPGIAAPIYGNEGRSRSICTGVDHQLQFEFKRMAPPRPFHAPLVIDNAPLRRRMIELYREAADQLDLAKSQLTIFTDRDQPAFIGWYQQTFAEALQRMESFKQEVREKQWIVQAVLREAKIRRISLRDAYRNFINGATYDEDLQNEEAARELFDDFLRQEGTKPESLDQIDYEARLEYFKGKLDGDPNFGNPGSGYSDATCEEENASSGAQGSPKLTLSLKTLYYQLARKLHPDATGSNDPALAKLWLQAQAAYEARDLTDLELIWARFNDGQVPQLDQESLSNIQNRTQAMRDAWHELQKQIRRARRDRAWGFSSPKKAGRLSKVQTSLERELNDEIGELRALRKSLEGFIVDCHDSDEAGDETANPRHP